MMQHTAEELNKLSKEEVIALLLQTQKQNALFMEQIATMLDSYQCWSTPV